LSRSWNERRDLQDKRVCFPRAQVNPHPITSLNPHPITSLPERKIAAAAATAQLEGADLQFSAVPTAYPAVDSFDFRAEVRRPLFRYAYDCARAGRLWTAFPRTANDNSTSRTMPSTQTVPCPADAPLIGSRLTFGNELAARPR
jgi:hypothetical protein